MIRFLSLAVRISFVIAVAVASLQAQERLTLKAAEGVAIENHPGLKAARYIAQAAGQTTAEVRSASLPTLFSSFTGAAALDNSRIAAGALNNPVIYDRVATGVTAGQLVTDFGRTSKLIASSGLHAESQAQFAEATRAQVIVDVDRAYFNALRAKAVLRVADQTVQERQVVLDQVAELAKNKLKSDLDVTFAKVNLSDAQMLQLNAQNEVRSTFADLAETMGLSTVREYQLVEEAMPGPLPPAPDRLVSEALMDRPDVAALRFERDSAAGFSEAERLLSRPSISAVTSLGVIPAHASQLSDRYAAAGFNVNIPIFNGGLYAARRKEAQFRAEASAERLKDVSNNVSRDVTVAWLHANTAFQRIALSNEMLNESKQSLELAQARYDLGLSSIVELNQAQLNETSAEITNASATYEYQLQRAILDYQSGVMH
jgi:outer membrane protein